jgi:hypothetical protein
MTMVEGEEQDATLSSTNFAIRAATYQGTTAARSNQSSVNTPDSDWALGDFGISSRPLILG